jgi:hypothetical protein
VNYTQLVEAINAFMHRTDLTPNIPTFIMLAEAQFKQNLRVKQMEVPLAPTTIVNNAITLPAGIVDVKDLWIPGDKDTLIRAPLTAVIAASSSGRPSIYALQGENTLIFNGASSIQGVVYQDIPALTTGAPTNWLATQAPGMYLYGALIQADIYTENDQTAHMAQYMAAKDSLIGADNRHTGPLVMRAR